MRNRGIAQAYRLCEHQPPMRVFVLTETLSTYLDWCAMRHVNPRAAECVTDPGELRGRMTPEDQLFDARTVRPAPTNEQRAA